MAERLTQEPGVPLPRSTPKITTVGPISSGVPVLLFLGLAAHAAPVVHVDRAARQVYVLDEAGAVVHQEPAGVGRGGLGRKTAMADLKTPTGTFSVDLVLGPEPQWLAVAPDTRASDPELQAFLEDRDGLARLWRNMGALDFDGDGAPDRAYGSAYVGLASTTGTAVTGPKMRRYRGTPYWYSIALHGTPDPSTLGQARSGGCVHLSASLIQRLLREGVLRLGAEVVIADGPPVLPGPDPALVREQ